jgi:hypothetical protein
LAQTEVCPSQEPENNHYPKKRPEKHELTETNEKTLREKGQVGTPRPLDFYEGDPYGDEKESPKRLKPPGKSVHSSDGKDIAPCDKDKNSDKDLQRAE